jgi:hypothetical protein
MAVLLAWIICPISFGLTFLIQSGYFIYKLITSQNVLYSENGTGRSIDLTPFEMFCCIGWAWTLCLDKATNRMALSTFIIWYIVGICINIFLTALVFLLFYFGYPVYV